MTILLKTAREKRELTDLYRALAKKLLIHGVRPEMGKNIMEHFDWMDAQSGRMNVRCELSTNPILGVTTMVIKVNFVEANVQHPN